MHAHYAHGTQPFLHESPDAIVIGHHDVNDHLKEIATDFATGGEFPEAVPALTARFQQQFALLLPPDGLDTGFEATIPPNKPKGMALATHLVREGDEVFRDPRSWRNGLQVSRDLELEVLVNTHALPTTGATRSSACSRTTWTRSAT